MRQASGDVMMKRTGSTKDFLGGVSRRQLFSYGAGLLAAGAFASKAQAQGAFQTAQVEWDDRFDGGSQAVQLPNTTVPLLSEQTVQSSELALQDCIAIEQRGGWQGVPGDARLRLGQRHPNVIALRQRLATSGDIHPNAAVASDTFDSYVEAGVKRFQARHGLNTTGLVAEATIAALNVPVSVRRQQLETNVVRLRSMTGTLGKRYVMVNIPAASIEAVEEGVVHSRHTAVVGKADRPSPVMTARIVDINFNPFWTVPASIVRKDLIPKMQADPGYLTKNKIRIFTQRGEELQPEQVNWTTDEATNYMFKQDPGDVNSLGAVRINLPNKDAVYMHDTPAKNIFGENARFHSSGCVRVQNVRELVAWLLKDSPGDWNRQKIDAVIRSGERIDGKLTAAIPVYWVYVSAWGGADGITQFRDDIYGRDGIGPIAMQQQ